ncbi:MAG: hypothetical protein OXF56_07895 [Rhodobacteraceae bacterium]|nr:hypothetical protein [Paracoccaceae bacterium]
MRTRINEELHWPFILSSHAARELHGIVNNGEVEIEADCNDGMRREFESIDELIDYNNGSSQKILNLKFESTNRVNDEYVSTKIEFCSERSDVFIGECKIRVWISGPDDLVSVLHGRIRTSIQSLRPWHSPLAKIGGGVIFFFSMGISMAVVLGISIAYFGVTFNLQFNTVTPQSLDTFLEKFGLIVPITFFALMISWFVGMQLAEQMLRFRQWLFPASTFTIGHQLNVEQNKDKWRRPVLLLTGVTIVSTILRQLYSAFF